MKRSGNKGRGGEEVVWGGGAGNLFPRKMFISLELALASVSFQQTVHLAAINPPNSI